MSIIAVRGIPQKWSLKQVVKVFAPVVGGQFEALNFVGGPGKGCKTCYLRLSAKLDPLQVLENINSIPKLKKLNIRAVIPKTVPDILLAAKPKQIPQKLARALHIPAKENENPHRVLIVTHLELMMEVQCKFTGLFNLSRRTPAHQLLQTVAQTLFERLHKIMESNEEARGSCLKLSSSYRRQHPHFGDFSMILDALHHIQAARGAPRSQITEQQLTGVTTQPYSINNIPYEKIQTVTSKYSLKITKKMLEHIRGLELEPEAGGGGGAAPEAAARRRVRRELQNVALHLPSIIRQVIQKHLSPEKSPFHRMRIYGEPFLPNKDVMSPVLRRFRAGKVMRSDRMYNLLKLAVPPDQFAALAALDGTVVGGAKLVIRSSDIPLYTIPEALLNEMKAAFGVDDGTAEENYTEGHDEGTAEMEEPAQ